MRDSLRGGTRVDGSPANRAPAGGPPNAGGSIGAHLAVAVLNISGWLQLWLHLTAFAVVARGSNIVHIRRSVGLLNGSEPPRTRS